MWWTADPPRPFQLCPVPICSALRFLVAGLPPAFIYRRYSRLSQGIACSYRVTLMVRPLLLAEPGPGDASCTTWTLSVIFHPLHFRAGRPSSKSAFSSRSVFQPLQIFRSFPAFQSLQTFRSSLTLNRFEPWIFSGFTTASNLPTFFSLPTDSGLPIFCCLSTASNLQVFSGLSTAPFFLRSQPFGWWVSF